MDDVKMSEMTHQCNLYLTFIFFCTIYLLCGFQLPVVKTDLGRHNCHLIYFGTELKIKKSTVPILPYNKSYILPGYKNLILYTIAFWENEWYISIQILERGFFSI